MHHQPQLAVAIAPQRIRPGWLGGPISPGHRRDNTPVYDPSDDLKVKPGRKHLVRPGVSPLRLLHRRCNSRPAAAAEKSQIGWPCVHLPVGIGWRATEETATREHAMTRTAVSSDQAPDALGPYSQAIVAGGLVFCSGMAGIDPATGTIADGIEAQTEQALLNLAAVLQAAGSSVDDVVKTTIFYANVEDFGRLNEVYARHMPDPPPARSAPANVRLPHGLLVSIEAIAVRPSSST